MNILNKKRLGDLLVEAGKITKEQLKTILEKQRISGVKLGELLVQEKILSEEDIIEVLEVQLGIQRVFLDMVEISKEAVKSIPQSMANKYNLIAIGYVGNKIKVALSDPLNLFAIDDIGIVTGRQVIPLIATKASIQKCIDNYYSSEDVKKAAEELNKSAVKQEAHDQIEELNDVKNAPVVKLVESVLRNAVKAKASDIHIEPFENYIKIRYRIDGVLQEVLRTTKETASSLVTRIKILASLDIAEKRVPQDGRIITKTDDKQIDLRVSVLPTVYGEKIVIRVLHRESFLISKENLGMSREDITKLDRIIKSPYGIILVTGPTGSGKSTTLYSVLGELNNGDANIITIEDPVEYVMDGINQVNVNTKAGLTFASGLRAMLRQDPDVMMVGEIRDSETAEIAVRSAITGHLVLSTIHTNDAISAIVRLQDMGIEPYLIAASLTAVVAQRLVKRICPKCREEYPASDYDRNILDVDKQARIMLSRGKGCNYCNNTGYFQRVGIYEMIEITREHRELIQNNSGIEKLREINYRDGVRTLKGACIDLVLKGETTMKELEKVAFLRE